MMSDHVAGNSIRRGASSPRRSRGFTLIELMVVIAIIGIIAAIAIPAYQDSVRSTRRSLAQSCLTEFANVMERFYTQHLQYHQTRAATPVAVADPDACSQDVQDFYTFQFADSQPTATTFVIEATPIGAQADDVCGEMSLSNTGAKLPATQGCWR